MKDAKRFSEERGLALNLEYPEPSVCTENGTNVHHTKMGEFLKKTKVGQLKETITEEKWQGKLTTQRWDDDNIRVKDCFTWLRHWTSCPSHTIAWMVELYEHLLPTHVYHKKKTRTGPNDEMSCRLCKNSLKTVQHVLSGCPAFAQRAPIHNAALKFVFFEMLKDLELVDKIPPWYSPVQAKPKYENGKVKAFWDVSVFGESKELKANRIDARIINHEEKKVITLEMSCPWTENHERKGQEKTAKYAPLQWELKNQYPGYAVEIYNIIVAVLGGWSKELDQVMRELMGKKGRVVLEKMQKAVISSTLNTRMARTFKVQV